jgi:hypothetical protein
MVQEYSDENLPIEIFQSDTQHKDQLSETENIFYRQLKLISLGERSIQVAKNDYYRASKQRASWVRNDLLYVGELENYENKLIDQWKFEFANMEDDLPDDLNIPEKIKKDEGKKLYKKVLSKEIYIRPKCQEPSIMRGSYHILADQLKVGWHIDYDNKLRKLFNSLKEGDTDEKLEYKSS